MKFEGLPDLPENSDVSLDEEAIQKKIMKNQEMISHFLPKIKEFSGSKIDQITDDDLNELLGESYEIDFSEINLDVYSALLELRQVLFRENDLDKAKLIMGKLKESLKDI